MNSIFIVLPILTLLMFDLGLTLEVKDFALLAKRPKAMMIGLIGQIVILPLVAWTVASAFNLPALMFLGVMLIACCPGGSSSNIFSMLAKGDVALSVSLTAFSSVITLFTVPVVLEWATQSVDTRIMGEGGIHLPVGNLLVQNAVTMLLPIIIGIVVRKYCKSVAAKIEKVLSKLAFPALMLLAGVFFVQHQDTIIDNFGVLGLCIGALLLASVTISSILAFVCMVSTQERRTIVIEVGMQNAAQAIAIASSPFIFNDGRIAIPAIIYALLMNVVLLAYVGGIKVANRWN